MGHCVLSAILFSPRGGSAHTARALARGLRSRGWSVTLVAGSRADQGGEGDAERFYGQVESVRFDPALATEAPLAFEGPPGTAPLHPSYEDRPDAPDRVFASLDELDYQRQVRAWAAALERAGARGADVLHLHHLTPLNEAALRVAPAVPVVGQLHGTELLMLERIAGGAPPGWRYAEAWWARMQAWAKRCRRLVVAPAGASRALRLLEVTPDRLVALPNGVDTALFAPREVAREALWRRLLVEQPRGWLPGEPPGSVRYGADAVARLARGTVLVSVGRFTAVKRLDLVIRAFRVIRERSPRPVGLVLVGGHPGEWEGEHPVELARRLGVPDVFLAGWRPHEELPDVLSACDAVVLASEREQFGQVLVEGMACGRPVVAPRCLGPTSIVEDGLTGWLVDPGDEKALADALAEVVADPAERARRGARARAAACQRFSWPQIVRRFEAVLEDAIGERHAGPTLMLGARNFA
jgi:glycosyltransferase involved in cell wall biosynthesis